MKVVRCRYNGGHDEGFADFDRAVLEGGAIELLELRRQLLNTPLNAIDLSKYYGGLGELSAVEQVEYCLEMFAGELANLLLIGGYGTGDFSMRGQFTVNLETGTIADELDS